MDKFDEWYKKKYGSLVRFERQTVAWKAWQESRRQAVAGERKRIVGIIDGANHAFIDAARMVSVDTVKDLIDKE